MIDCEKRQLRVAFPAEEESLPFRCILFVLRFAGRELRGGELEDKRGRMVEMGQRIHSRSYGYNVDSAFPMTEKTKEMEKFRGLETSAVEG